MTDVEAFEILIIGSGQGGKLLAWQLAKAGRKVAVVERQWVGGSCPAVACIPSKNWIWSARVAHLTRHAEDFGAMTGPVTTDMSKVRSRKRQMVEGEDAFHIRAYKETGGELVMGTARFTGPKTIEVALNDGGTRILKGAEVYINVGTHATIPEIPGLSDAQAMTHIHALELDYLPDHLLVLGGGYVGVEMAQAYRRFGSRVTLIEPGPRILGREDTDVSDELYRILGNEGIEIVLNATPLKVEGKSGHAVRMVLQTPTDQRSIEGTDLLIAVGRSPNTPGLGLEKTGVELDNRGFVRVNDRLETTAPGIWAIGEAAGSPQFTHVSVDDYRIIRDNRENGNRSTADRLLPYVLFTDPPVARVGLSEMEADRRGTAVRVAKLPVSSVLRTEATGETDGFMKAVVSNENDTILGFTMIGSEAGEVMAAVQVAMMAGLPYQRLRDAVLTHLTMAEGLGLLFARVENRG